MYIIWPSFDIHGESPVIISYEGDFMFMRILS